MELFGALNSIQEKVLYTIINVTIIIVASVLNITIIVLIKTRPVLHKPSFILLGALACSDLALVCLVGILYLAITLKGISAGNTITVVTCYITSAIVVNNLLLLCCITYDRYQCIKHSMDNRPYTSMRRVCIKIGLCTVTSLIFPLMFYIESVVKLPFRTLEVWCVIMAGSFSYIIVYYIKLKRIVRTHHVHGLGVGLKDSHGNSVRRVPSYHSNLNKSVFLLIASYIFAYFPVSTVSIVRTISYRLNMPSNRLTITAIVWSATFSLSNAVMDPLIYAYRSDTIGREFRKVFTPALYRAHASFIRELQLGSLGCFCSERMVFIVGRNDAVFNTL